MSDVIYRQDAIDAIVAWTVENRPDIEMPTDLVDRIKELPSAERKGKWIRESLVTDYPYKCSVCKKYSRAMYDFCPNCGADMQPNNAPLVDDSIYG